MFIAAPQYLYTFKTHPSENKYFISDWLSGHNRADMSRHTQCWPSTDAGSPTSHICPLRLRMLYHPSCRWRVCWTGICLWLYFWDISGLTSPLAGEQTGPTWTRPFHPRHQGKNKEEKEVICEIFYLEGMDPVTVTGCVLWQGPLRVDGSMHLSHLTTFD